MQDKLQIVFDRAVQRVLQSADYALEHFFYGKRRHRRRAIYRRGWAIFDQDGVRRQAFVPKRGEEHFIEGFEGLEPIDLPKDIPHITYTFEELMDKGGVFLVFEEVYEREIDRTQRPLENIIIAIIDKLEKHADERNDLWLKREVKNLKKKVTRKFDLTYKIRHRLLGLLIAAKPLLTKVAKNSLKRRNKKSLEWCERVLQEKERFETPIEGELEISRLLELFKLKDRKVVANVILPNEIWLSEQLAPILFNPDKPDMKRRVEVLFGELKKRLA